MHQMESRYMRLSPCVPSNGALLEVSQEGGSRIVLEQQAPSQNPAAEGIGQTATLRWQTERQGRLVERLQGFGGVNRLGTILLGEFLPIDTRDQRCVQVARVWQTEALLQK